MSAYYLLAYAAMALPTILAGWAATTWGLSTVFPWFVGVVDGKRDFRVADQVKRVLAVKKRLCWICGDKLGRHLGFPTANVVLLRKPALSGIFAVRVHGLGGEARAGVASLGVRPTVKQGARPLLEVFVFDFDEAIYGRRITVEFLHKLRDEERYADLDRLTRQIRVDVAQARDYFATVK